MFVMIIVLDFVPTRIIKFLILSIVMNHVLISFAKKGKTMSLLCSVLTYLTIAENQSQNNENEKPAIEISNQTFKNWLTKKSEEFSKSKKAKHDSDSKNLNDFINENILRVKNGINVDPADFQRRLNCFGKPLPVKRLIFVSRTHSQLKQVYSEFKNSPFASKFKISIAGSRSQFCINKNVVSLKNNFAITEKCKKLVKSNLCHHYDRDQIFKEKFNILVILKNFINLNLYIKNMLKIVLVRVESLR